MTRYDVYAGVPYAAALSLTEYLYTLLAAVGSLIELAGEILNGEHPVCLRDTGKLVIDNVNGRLREHRAYGGVEILLAELVCVISVEDADARNIKSEGSFYIAENRLSLYCKFRLFFNINSEYGHNSVSLQFNCSVTLHPSHVVARKLAHSYQCR